MTCGSTPQTFFCLKSTKVSLPDKTQVSCSTRKQYTFFIRLKYLCQPAGSVTDYYRNLYWFVTVFFSESGFGFRDECIAKFSLDEVDGTATEAASHNAGTCHTALLCHCSKEVKLFAILLSAASSASAAA